MNNTHVESAFSLEAFLEEKDETIYAFYVYSRVRSRQCWFFG